MNKRLEDFREVMAHRKAFNRVAVALLGYNPYKGHDLWKAINILLFGDRIATKLHRRFSSHHEQNGDIRRKLEAAIDWECARITKPTKPLNAYQTWRKFYAHVDMSGTLTFLGLNEDVNNDE